MWGYLKSLKYIQQLVHGGIFLFLHVAKTKSKSRPKPKILVPFKRRNLVVVRLLLSDPSKQSCVLNMILFI